MARPKMTDAHREMLEALGQNLRECREASGLTLEAVADAIGADRQYVGEVEAGRVNIGATRVIELARALSVPASRIFEGLA